MWARSPSRRSSQQNVMPGFPFPAAGPLGFGSPPYRSENSDHRYYGQLRLPDVHLRLVRCSLSSPDTLYCSSLFVVPCGLSEKLELSCPEPGVFPIRRSPPTVLYKETSGSPKFPGYPCNYMPCSQTPVVSWSLAVTQPELLPSVIHTTSAFTPGFPEAILRPP